MVLHDGALGGNAGQDALAAAAKAAHQVVYGAADDDDLAARAQRVYPNLRTAGGGADKNEIVRHAIMIGNGKAGVDLRRDEGFQLFLRHGPVGAERHEDGDIFAGDAERIRQIGGEKGHDFILPHPKAGDIADDDGDFVLRTEPIFQRGANGPVRDAVQEGLGQIAKRGQGRALQHTDAARVFNGKGKLLFPVFERKALRCHTKASYDRMTEKVYHRAELSCKTGRQVV